MKVLDIKELEDGSATIDLEISPEETNLMLTAVLADILKDEYTVFSPPAESEESITKLELPTDLVNQMVGYFISKAITNACDNINDREDGPAIEWKDGSKFWYLNGEHHREDGPAVEYANGGKEWWLNGKRHRENGPAIEYDSGTKKWYLNGELHREDGPAVEYSDGYKEWWVNGKKMTEEKFKKATTSPKVKEMTMEEVCKELGYSVKIIRG